MCALTLSHRPAGRGQEAGGRSRLASPWHPVGCTGTGSWGDGQKGRQCGRVPPRYVWRRTHRPAGNALTSCWGGRKTELALCSQCQRRTQVVGERAGGGVAERRGKPSVGAYEHQWGWRGRGVMCGREDVPACCESSRRSGGYCQRWRWRGRRHGAAVILGGACRNGPGADDGHCCAGCGPLQRTQVCSRVAVSPPRQRP